jgi:hypothetical protein
MTFSGAELTWIGKSKIKHTVQLPSKKLNHTLKEFFKLGCTKPKQMSQECFSLMGGRRS